MNDFLILVLWFRDFFWNPIKFFLDYPIVLSLISLAVSVYALKLIFDLEKELDKLKKSPDNKAVKFKFFLVMKDNTLKEITKMEQIGVGGVAKVVIQPVDKYENAAKLDGKPVIKNLNEDLGSFVQSEDGLSFDVSNPGKMGVQKFEMEGDADLGEGVVPVVGSVEIEWVAGIAVSLKTVVMKVEQAPAAEAKKK
jgi:hypothetical protein